MQPNISSRTAKTSTAVQELDREAAPSADAQAARESRDASHRQESLDWHEPPWWKQAIVAPFAGIWTLLDDGQKKVRAIIVAAAVGFVVSLLKGQTSLDPRTWQVSVSQYLSSLGQNLAIVAGVVVILTSIAFVAWRAYRTKKKWEGKRADAKAERERGAQTQAIVAATVSGMVQATERRELTDYDPRPVRGLGPTDCAVAYVNPIYLKHINGIIYLPREADKVARDTLRKVAARNQPSDGGLRYQARDLRAATARNQPSDGGLRYQATDGALAEGTAGICLVGPHNIGKSRLAWEMLYGRDPMPELQEWTFVRWPSAADHPFPFELMKGKRVIILMDKLEDLAQSADPVLSRLNRVRREFQEANIPLIIIATLRDRSDRKVRENLASLLSSLDLIEVDPILPDDEAKLENDLRNIPGIEVHDWDETTPGSLITGLPSDAYEKLLPNAKHVMKVLRLLDSVGFGAGTAFTKAEVCAVASAVFDVPRLDWRAAREELYAQHMIEMQWNGPSHELAIVATREALGLVNDYPLDSDEDLMELEDWPTLFEVFKREQDIDALTILGSRWWESELPYRYARLLTQLEYLVRAADCFRAGLAISDASTPSDPSQQASLQSNLAEVLLQQYNFMPLADGSPTRVEVLKEAADAFQKAREQYADDADTPDRDSWITLTSLLAVIVDEQSKFVEGDAKVALLHHADELATASFKALTAQTSADTGAQSKKILAYIRVDQAMLATTPDEASRLLTEARTLADDALRDRRTSDPQKLNQEAFALAQGDCSYVLRFQASQASGEQRISMLKQSEALLRDALKTLPEAADSTTDSRTWLQTMLADTLLQLARLAPAAAEEEGNLSEAETLCRNITETPSQWYSPVTWAWIQGVYGGVFAEQAASAEAEKRESLLNEALNYCISALNESNRESAPDNWAGTVFNSAELALRIARYLGPTEREAACSWLEQGQELLDAALGVYTAPVFSAESGQALALQKEIENYKVELECPAGTQSPTPS